MHASMLRTEPDAGRVSLLFILLPAALPPRLRMLSNPTPYCHGRARYIEASVLRM